MILNTYHCQGDFFSDGPGVTPDFNTKQAQEIFSPKSYFWLWITNFHTAHKGREEKHFSTYFVTPRNTAAQDFFPCGHLRMSKNATFARYQTGTREHDLPIPESTATLICFQTSATGGMRGSRLLNIQDGTSGGDFPIPESTATQVFFPGGHLRRTRDLCLTSRASLAKSISQSHRALQP